MSDVLTVRDSVHFDQTRTLTSQGLLKMASDGGNECIEHSLHGIYLRSEHSSLISLYSSIEEASQ